MFVRLSLWKTCPDLPQSVWINTDTLVPDLSPLESLPALHEATIRCDDEEPPSLARLRSKLTPWDVEFRAPKPRYMPSLKVEVVDQQTFDLYDTKMPYNIRASDTNEQLLTSELCWLDQQIENVLSREFQDEDDYSIPTEWSHARSRTVVLCSERSVKSLLKIGARNSECPRLCRRRLDHLVTIRRSGCGVHDMDLSEQNRGCETTRESNSQSNHAKLEQLTH